MKAIKEIVLIFSPMFLVYLINILIFNTYPAFLPCLVGSAMYINCLYKIKSFNKVVDNLLEKEKKKIFNTDFINLALVFTMTLVITFLIYLVLKIQDIGYPFSMTAIIFVLMVHFKIPKRFFN